MRCINHFGILLAMKTAEEFKSEFAEFIKGYDDLVEIRKAVGPLLTQEKHRREEVNLQCVMDMKPKELSSFRSKIDVLKLINEVLQKKITYAKGTVRKYLCDICWQAYEIEKIFHEAEERYLEYQRKQMEYQSELDRKQREREAIEQANMNLYLDSRGKEGNSSVSDAYRWVKRVLSQTHINDLRSMKYNDFLNTNYWWVVRKYKLQTSKFECNLCNSKGKLHVHHRHYKNRGQEINYLDDLTVLCEKCHERHHTTLQVKEEKNSQAPEKI